jgi:glycosyltransferase involved in cell wall biosynthesis
LPSVPKVSILLPCLNARPYLESRIDSLLAQTCSDWEAIVLDSHSDDGSWEFFQSIAATDSRFQLNQVPREGVYAALNRGVQLATGEFLHIATCDDAMVPDFLDAMLEAFKKCPEAGIAACDVSLIDESGNPLSADQLNKHLPPSSIHDLLDSGSVRSSRMKEEHINYRPVPHDCLLHFGGRSVYFSLTQLLIRTALAKAAAPFETTVGSVADFGWLLRLTNHTGSVHLPEKLAIWRFHGDQLSVHRDASRRGSLKMICERARPEIYERHRRLLTSNDCAALLLPTKALQANSIMERFRSRIETVSRVLWMFVEKPASTLRAIRRTGFRVGKLRQTLVPMMLQRMGLTPKEL